MRLKAGLTSPLPFPVCVHRRLQSVFKNPITATSTTLIIATCIIIMETPDGVIELDQAAVGALRHSRSSYLSIWPSL